MPPVGKRKINQAFFGGEKAKKAWQEGTEEEEEEEEEEESKSQCRSENKWGGVRP